MNEDIDEGPIVVAIGNFNYSGGFRFKSTRIKRYTADYPKDYVLNPGDILLAMTCQTAGGEILGIPGVVPNDNEVYLHNQRLGKLVIKKTQIIDKEYLYWLFLTKNFNHHLFVSASGTKILHTSPTKICNYKVTIPPIFEQKKIASILWNIQKKIELNNQINQTLEAMAQALFKSWFVDFEPVKAKIEAKAAGADAKGVTLAAMETISGQNAEALTKLAQTDPERYAELKDTAELFPDALVESELGEIPAGWEVHKVKKILQRLKPKKRYTKKQVLNYGRTPVLEQGSKIVMGFHNESPDFYASSDDPVFIFGDHTCVTYLSCQPFDISQNVIPLKGAKLPTLWVYYSVKDLQKFQEYRRHWSELIVKDVVTPSLKLTQLFSTKISTFHKIIEANLKENANLELLRDILLPKLLSGEISIENLEVQS